ncbi:MAG TPA: TolC family protein [Vicinamibacterales bacterium]
MMLRRLVLTALCAPLATGLPTGCIHFQPKPVVAADTLAAFEARTLDAPGLQRFFDVNHDVAPAPSAPWNLRALTLAAFYYHPDLDVARAGSAVARAGIVTAGERPNPTASFGPGYNSTTPAGLITPWILSFDFDIPIETAGKRGYRLAQARHLTDAARLNIATVAWQVRSRVRSRLLDLHAAVETGALLEKQQEIQAGNVKILELQLSAGAVSPFEVTQARIALDAIRLAQRDAARQQAESRAQLAAALGVTAHSVGDLPISFDEFTKTPSEVPGPEASREALLNRADVLGALAEYDASQASLQLEIARQYPDIHLGPGYQMDQTDSKWTIALPITLPVFNRNKGAIGEADARRAEAANRFIAVQARAIGEVELAVVSYRSAVQKVSSVDAMMADLTRQEQTAQRMFKAGEISRLELGSTQLELYTGALAHLDALIKAQQALGALEDAMQRSGDLSAWLSTVPQRDAGAIRARD